MKAQIAFVAIVSCLSAPAGAAGSPEQAYIKARNAYIEKFETDEKADEKAALADLERKFRQIIGPVSVEGFSPPGKFLSALRKYEGEEFDDRGRPDRLWFSNKQETLTVTTITLLKLRFAGEPKPPEDLPKLDFAALATGESMLQQIWDTNARYYHYADVPVKAGDGRSYVNAFLGLGTQDVGAFPPGTLFVFVAKGERIFWYVSDIKLPDIAQCKREWGKEKNEELAFRAYYECYGKEAKNQPFFAGVAQRAQSVVDRLTKDPAAKQ